MDAETQHPVLRLTVKLSATVGEHIFCTAAGALPEAGGNALGPADYAGVSGGRVPVTALGAATGIAAAEIASGDALMVDAAGKLKKLGGDKVTVGRALAAAGAAGDKLPVLLIPN